MGRSLSRAWEFQVALLALGLLATGLVLRFAFFGISTFLLGVGGSLIVFGLMFDLYGRVLGTLAARDEGERGWALACALIGSPALIGHARHRHGDPIELYPGALVGLLALVGMFTIFFASAATGLKGP